MIENPNDKFSPNVAQSVGCYLETDGVYSISHII